MVKKSMRNALLLSVLILLPTGMGYAQPQSLSDQIDAVAAVQDREQARQREWYQQQAEAEARAVAARAAAQRAVAAADERRRQALHDEALADKKRDQTYEDQLRQQQVEAGELKLEAVREAITTDKQRQQAFEDKQRELALRAQEIRLKELETRAGRQNDIIDHELKRQDAETDVVQSGADATRAIANGAGTHLTDRGIAEVKKQSAFFGR
jgi:hypothetical protein